MALPDAEILTAAGQKIAAKNMPSGRVAEVVVIVNELAQLLGTTANPVPVGGTVTYDTTQETTRNGYLASIVTGLTDLSGGLTGATPAAADVSVATTGYANFTATDMQAFAAELDTLITSILSRLTALEP